MAGDWAKMTAAETGREIEAGRADPVALADGIRTLLDDAALRRRLALAGSARARDCGGVAAVRSAFREAVAGMT